MAGLLTALASVATIFGWSFFSFWSAIPAGIALGVSPVIVGITVTVSYGCGVALVVVVGTSFRDWFRRWRANRDEENTPDDDAPAPELETEPSRMVEMVKRAWVRYGLIGLAILAPMTVGAQIGAGIGLGLGENPRRLVVAMTIGAGIWAILITIVSYFTGEAVLS